MSKEFLAKIGGYANPNFVAIIIPDGSNMSKAKSFKYNFEEVFCMNPVKAEPPNRPKVE